MKYQWVVKIDGGNVAGITLVGATINYGRRTVDEQPAPTSATMTLLTPDASPTIAQRFPDFGPGDFAARSGFVQAWEPTYIGANSRLTIGAPVVLEAILPGGFVQEWEPDYSGGSQLRRFTGRITALDYAYGTVRVTAVDALESLARITVATARPAETDVERARAWAKLAGIELVVDGTYSVKLLPVDRAGTGTALAQLYATAKESGAVVYADRYGDVHYRTRTAPLDPTTELPGKFTILDSLSMKAELGEVINRVEVEWGVEGSDKKRPVVVREDSDSIKRFGLFSSRRTTQLATEADAIALAERIITNESKPLYAMPEARVTLIKADPITVDRLADLDLDDSVKVAPLPVGAPAQSYTARVLGYVEEAANPDWLITYQLAPSSFLEERLEA